MNHECETCKHTELNGCDYPCHCCSVVYQNTGFSDMWEQGGCDFCNEKKNAFTNNYSIHIEEDTNELYFKHDNEYEYEMLKINFCPICGRKLNEVAE